MLIIAIMIFMFTLTSCEKTETLVALSKIFKFLKPFINDHVHTIDTIPAVAFTCLEHGYTEGKYCVTCGETLVAPKELLTLGSHIESIIPVVEATCTTTGLSEGKDCSKCGQVVRSGIGILSDEDDDALPFNKENDDYSE